MNTPNDLRWIMFATVPVHGYVNVNVATPIARGIVWMYRRAAAQVGRRCSIARPRTSQPEHGHGLVSWS